MIPKPGEHCFIAGQTGSGKTAGACQVLLRLGRPVVIIDSKNEERFETLPNVFLSDNWDRIKRAIDDVQTRFFVWRPESNDKNDLDDALADHYENHEGVAVYIDEAYTLHARGIAGDGLISNLTRGRSREISVIMATQRPAWISRFAITEARHHHIYGLAHKDDLKMVGNVIPDFHLFPPPGKHGFYYYNTDERQLRRFGPWNINAQGIDIPEPPDVEPMTVAGAQLPSKPKPRLF